MKEQVFRKKSIERLAHPENLDALMDVTRPQGWLILATLALLITLLGVWSATGSVAVREPVEGMLLAGNGNDANDANSLSVSAAPLRAVVWVSTAAGRSLRPGMEAHLLPAGLSPQRHGFLRGRITEIAEQPKTRTEMTTVLEDEAAAVDLHGRGLRVRVEVTLMPAESPTHTWAWTSFHQPEPQLTPRTPITGTIVVQRVRPIEQILPWLNASGGAR